MTADGAELFAADGARKYVSESELRRFVREAGECRPAIAALCYLLAYTGCRLSEALAVTRAQLDPETGRVIFRTLKRRRRTFRAQPIPDELMMQLQVLAPVDEPDRRLWRFCRQTAWREVKAVMRRAGITGAQATPKGLRHGFGIANAEEGVLPALTQRWMGHARPETTAIYQFVTGAEERAFAERIWRRLS